MVDLIFFAACGLVGMLPAIVALMLERSDIAALITLAWSAVSIAILWSISLGLHGFVLFAFIPFWAGNAVALIWALVRLNKERALL